MTALLGSRPGSRSVGSHSRIAPTRPFLAFVHKLNAAAVNRRAALVIGGPWSAQMWIFGSHQHQRASTSGFVLIAPAQPHPDFLPQCNLPTPPPLLPTWPEGGYLHPAQLRLTPITCCCFCFSRCCPNPCFSRSRGHSRCSTRGRSSERLQVHSARRLSPRRACFSRPLWPAAPARSTRTALGSPPVLRQHRPRECSIQQSTYARGAGMCLGHNRRSLVLALVFLLARPLLLQTAARGMHHHAAARRVGGCASAGLAPRCAWATPQPQAWTRHEHARAAQRWDGIIPAAFPRPNEPNRVSPPHSAVHERQESSQDGQQRTHERAQRCARRRSPLRCVRVDQLPRRLAYAGAHELRSSAGRRGRGSSGTPSPARLTLGGVTQSLPACADGRTERRNRARGRAVGPQQTPTAAGRRSGSANAAFSASKWRIIA